MLFLFFESQFFRLRGVKEDLGDARGDIPAPLDLGF